MTYPLMHPTPTITELAIRRPRGKDYVAAEMETGSLRRHYALYASIAGIDLDQFLDLDVDDIAQFIEKADSLAGESQPQATGAT